MYRAKRLKKAKELREWGLVPSTFLHWLEFGHGKLWLCGSLFEPSRRIGWKVALNEIRKAHPAPRG